MGYTSSSASGELQVRQGGSQQSDAGGVLEISL
jgi:hypothetical protein